MRGKLLFLILIFSLLPGANLLAQSGGAEATPATEAGEDLDLYGVLELFIVAEDLEAFEKALNDPKSEVNNLDLDGNGEVDYIRVEEHVEGNTHVIVLQVPLGENDYQDMATIEVEKLANEEYTLQAVGNEEIYGANYIVEPNPEGSPTSAQEKTTIEIEVPSEYGYSLQPYGGEEAYAANSIAEPSLASHSSAAVIVVRRIPVVIVIFSVGYSRYVSPWRWGHFPGWWSPWRIVARSIHRSRVRRFHKQSWHRTTRRRSTHSRNVYRTKQKSSAKAVNKKKKTTTKKAPTKKKAPVKKKTPTKKKKKKIPSHENQLGVAAQAGHLLPDGASVGMGLRISI